MTNRIEYVKGKASLVYETNTKENTIDFKIVQLFINNSNIDIAVLGRNNLPIIINKGTGGSNNVFTGYGNFIIRTLYHFNSKSRIVSTINAIQAYKEKYKIVQEDLELLLKGLLLSFDRDKNLSFITIGIDKEIPSKTIKEFGSVYLTDCDFLVMDSSSLFEHVHPYSQEGLARSNHEEFIIENKVSGIFMELIDNDRTVKNRYCYIAKHLIEVPVLVDMNKNSGVYFTTVNFDSLDNATIVPEYCTIDEAETVLGLFKTKEEAISGGNPDILSRIEESKYKIELNEAKQLYEKTKMKFETEQLAVRNKLTDAELMLEQQKATNSKLKEELDKDRNERQHILEKTKSEYEQAKFIYESKLAAIEFELNQQKAVNSLLKDTLDHVKAQRSDNFETKSHNRKDFSEILKIAGIILATGLSAFAIYKKST